MSRSSTSFVVIVGLALAASAVPALAQRPEKIVRTRTPIDSLEPRLQRMELSIDSLVRLFDEETNGERRMKLRRQIDEQFAEFRALRMSAFDARSKEGNFFVWRTPEPLALPRFGSNGEIMFPRATQAAMPTGWIGIVVGGAPIEIRVENNEMYMRYLSYPEITSVDPSSPAQRVGIAPGDTLMAYNGHDVRREEISMTRLLRPKSTVTVRVRREGRTKDLPVVVAETPDRIKIRRDVEMRGVEAPWLAAPRVPEGPRVALAPPSPRVFSPSIATTRPVNPARPAIPSVPMFALAPNGVAGAQVVTVSEAMKRSLDLPPGVLVTTVPPGSPAGESGLEEGDVIIRAGARTVQTVVDLREMVARAAESGERSVQLELRRGKDRRTLTLRWSR